MDFAALAKRGFHLVVVRAQLDYKAPLASGDRFVVGLDMVRESPVKFAFHQDIFRLPDHRPVLRAKVFGTALNERGRPEIAHPLERMLADSAAT